MKLFLFRTSSELKFNFIHIYFSSVIDDPNILKLFSLFLALKVDLPSFYSSRSFLRTVPTSLQISFPIHNLLPSY